MTAQAKERLVLDYDEEADAFSETICPTEPAKVIVARRSWTPVIRRVSDELIWRSVQIVVFGISAVVVYIVASVITWLIGKSV